MEHPIDLSVRTNFMKPRISKSKSIANLNATDTSCQTVKTLEGSGK